MNALAQPPVADALYLYAVLPTEAAPLPDAPPIPAATHIDTLAEAGLTALVSWVPRCLFEADHPLTRAADPAWIAACATAHHHVVALATQAGPCLPLGFGTVFASDASLRAWLVAQARALHTTLESVAGRQEWGVSLIEDQLAHTAWLEAHEPDLRRLADAARTANPGTAYLLKQRLLRAREAARAQHAHAAASRLAERLTSEGLVIRRDPAEPGFVWSLLGDRDAGLTSHLEALGAALFGSTGLALRVSGPFPPYAFARAAWQACGHE